MIAELDREGFALLKLLVQVLRDADSSDPRTFITYTEAHKRLGIPILFGNAGRSLQSQGLNSLADWTKKQGVPAITGLVVREQKRDPGPGYFKTNGKREIEDVPWWLNEIRRAKETSWNSYIGEANTENVTAPADTASSPLTIASIAQPDSRFS